LMLVWALQQCSANALPLMLLWSHVNKATVGRQLEYVQQLACLYITGAIRTTPASSL